MILPLRMMIYNIMGRLLHRAGEGEGAGPSIFDACRKGRHIQPLECLQFGSQAGDGWPQYLDWLSSANKSLYIL